MPARCRCTRSAAVQHCSSCSSRSPWWLGAVVSALATLLLLPGVKSSNGNTVENSKPSDPQASAATRALFTLLAQLSAAPQLQLALGQQRANQEGRGWQSMSGDANRSDILTGTGDWPVVFGFNFAALTGDPEKTVPEYIRAIKDVGALGGIVAAHFPTNNPLGCSNSSKYTKCQKDPTGKPMKNLLPGRAGNKQWTTWLDLVAEVCKGVAPIPILFRPFHENYLPNWWGAPYCTPDEFKAGWQYTVSYLRNTRKVHNMLLVYAPDQPSMSITSPLGYGERWPGDGYADIAAFDHYDHPPQPHHCATSNFSTQFLQDIHKVVNFAAGRGKVPAIAEFGIKTGMHATLDADWWTRCFLDPIAADPLASKVAYAMTWTNSGSSPNDGFVPLQGDFTFSSFRALYSSNCTVFLRAWNRLKTDDGTPLVPACTDLKPPFCDCHHDSPGAPSNCSCARCGTCKHCLHCQRCTGALPPPAPPPPPPMPRPGEWLGTDANVLATTELLKSGFNDANVGNGFVAFKVGDHCGSGATPNSCPPPPAQLGAEDSQRTLGGLHVGGVFNGLSNYTVSHRARLPSLHNGYLAAPGMKFVAQALDVQRGVWLNRTMLHGVTVEQRIYCHRTRRNVMVMEVAALNWTAGAPPLQLQLVQRADLAEFAAGTVDIDFQPPTAAGGVTAVRGATKQPELYGSQPTHIGLAFDHLPHSLTLDSDNLLHRFVAAVHTDLEGIAPTDLSITANATLAAAKALSPAALLAEHTAGWAELHDSAGIEISGNATVARAVNASLYYIHSAVRADWPHGLSPGGLAIDSYDGRSFWDCETWMFPVLDVFSAELGASLLQYRLQRLPAAQARAAQFGIPGGAMFPWTSTQTGYGTTHVAMNSSCHGHVGPDACLDGLGWTEQHITGDIAMAFRLHWRTTYNQSFLRESWELINATAAFFAGRFTAHSSAGGSGRTTNYSLTHVTSPDESAGPQDDEVYTNAIGAATIAFALEVGKLLGVAPAPNEWAAMAAAPYLPLSSTLPHSNGAQIHPEFAGYAGGPADCCGREDGETTSSGHCCITQSAATLLQYPLGVEMPDKIKINDLKYYEPRTRQNGFFTGDSIYSIAWLALGNTSAALGQWDAAFAHMDCEHFCLFREELTGGHSNFITGSGGFLQNIIQGWAGVRVGPDAMTLRKPTLPPTAESIKLRGLQLGGAKFSVQYNTSRITFARSSLSTTTLHVDDGSTTSHLVTAGGISFPLGAGSSGEFRLRVGSTGP